MNKKVIAVLLSLCIIFSLIPAVAQTEAVVSFSNQEIFADAGEVVELMLDLSGCEGFTDLGLEIQYDTGVMQLVNVEANPSVGLDSTTAQNFDKNPYNIGWNGTGNTYFNGTLAIFIFRILPDAPAGDYIVNVDYYKGRNGDYKDGISVNYDENDNPLNLIYKPCRIFVEGNNNTPPGGGSIGGGGGTGERTTASLSKAEGYAGENVDVTLDLSNNTGFANLGFEIAYESSSLTLLKVNNNVSGVTFTTAESIGENPFNAGWDSVSDIEYNGNLATFTFKINEETPAGTYPVTLSYYKGRNGNYIDGVSVNYDENDNPLDLLYADGCITVLEKQVEEPDESVYRVEFVSEKKEYAIGEPFEVDVWLYTDDYVIRIYDDYKIEGFDSSRAGICNVVVSYGGYSQQFQVEIIEDKVIETIETYVVQAVAAEGAVISPSGYSQVKEGTVMKFAVSTQDGYEIKNVSVNGEYAEITDGNITVTVNQNTIIETFAEKKKYSVIATTNGNGYVELSSDSIEYGSNCTAKIVADDGYIISDVLVDGKSVGVCKAYTFTNIKENHTIDVVFEKVIKTVTVRASATQGGKVYPAKSTINSGTNAKFTITPDYGYRVDYIIIDGEKKDILSNEIIIENVTGDTDVSVVFEKVEFSVTVNNSEGINMSVEYKGQSAQSLNVPYMEQADIVITLEEGYKLNTLYVNNTPVKAQKTNDRLVYNAVITKDTVVSARCAVTVEYEFNQKVAQAGLAAEINILNAHSKKEIFTQLAEEYARLSTTQQRACTSAYATVLAALDRANAYIALADSNIIERITQLPSPRDLTAMNYRVHKAEIDSIYSEYEKMTYLSKSLIDYVYVTKLNELKKKTEELDKESKGIISYLYELVDSVPDDNFDENNLAEAYSKLMLAEETYYGMSEQDKGDVSETKYNELINKHGEISTQIQRLYVTPFTSRVLRCSPVTAEDTFADAESKRVTIYNLMNEYHSFPAFVQEQIFSSTIQKLNSLYESASIKVSTTVNNLPVDMNGDFDEEVELVLTEPELDDNAVSDATGKSVYQAIDVKMYSNEQEIQPASKIRIKMEISKELSNADVSVVYINDEGVVYDVQGEVIEEDEKYYIVFFIDHFSSFAVLYDQSVAEETQISFESDYAETGDVVTVNITGTVNTANCIMLLTGYSETGEVTFVKMANGSASATIVDKTDIVKAMLWNKAMAPITDDIILTVTE